MKRNAVLVAAIAGVVLILGGVFLAAKSEGFLASWLAQGTQAKKESCAPPKAREFNREPYYTGKLVDPHLHLPTVSGIVSSVSTKMGKPTPAWDKDLSLDYLNCLFENGGISQAFGFHLLTKYSHGGEVSMAKRMEKKYPGKVAHFLMPTFITPWIDVEAKTVRNILEKNPGLFVGFGELKPFDDRALDSPSVIELYELAKKYKLIVMIHALGDFNETIEKVLKQYPDVKFLFHGMDWTGGEENPRLSRDNIEWLARILKDYPNAYYSLGNHLPFYGYKKEHVGKAVPKEETLPEARAKFNKLLDEDILRWKRRIEANPAKFLLAETDSWHRPQFDEEVRALMIEYIRSFIGSLNPAIQEQVAHQNAERLLQGAGIVSRP